MNSCFGFDVGASGVAHEIDWISTATDKFGSDYVLSSQSRDLYRANGEDYTSVPRTHTTATQLGINKGVYGDENSDFGWYVSWTIGVSVNRMENMTL